jgi:hypothetical protein
MIHLFGKWNGGQRQTGLTSRGTGMATCPAVQPM